MPNILLRSLRRIYNAIDRILSPPIDKDLDDKNNMYDHINKKTASGQSNSRLKCDNEGK